MSLNTTNYSHKAFSVADKHHRAFKNIDEEIRYVQVPLKISVNIQNLELQANAFAQYIRYQNHMRFERGILFTNKAIEVTLYEVYIYSYVKSLYNGVYVNKLSKEAISGHFLEGHLRFYHLIANRVFSFTKDEICYNFDIYQLSNSEKRMMFSKLFLRFDFLNEFNQFVSDGYGTNAFRIESYENVLMYLKNTVDELNNSNRTKNRPMRSNKNFGDSKDSNANSDKSDVQKEDNNSNSNHNSKARISKSSDLGELVSVIDFTDHSILSNVKNSDNNPLLNAFLNADESKLYYIEVTESNKKVLFNPSFSFNKANFIILDESRLQDMFWISSVYRVEPIKRLEFLVCSEVFTNSGVKPKNYKLPDKNNKLDSFFDKIIPILDKFEDSNLDKFIKDKMYNIIKQYMNVAEDKIQEWLDKELEPYSKSS